MNRSFRLACAFFLGAVMVVGSMVAIAGDDSAANAERIENKGVMNSSASVAETEELKALKKLMLGAKPMTWVFVGDSITHGACHTHGWRSYSEHFAERIRWELKRYADIVINTGITDDKTSALLKAWNERVGCFKPHVVSIMEGMNDSCNKATDEKQFSDNLSEIVRRIRSSKAIPILHTMNTIKETDLQRKDLPNYVKVICAVAKKERVILVDNWKFWNESSLASHWLNDAIHPNEVGHRAIADELFRTLGIFDEVSPTCSLSLTKP